MEGKGRRKRPVSLKVIALMKCKKWRCSEPDWEHIGWQKAIRYWIYFEGGASRICWWIACGVWKIEVKIIQGLRNTTKEVVNILRWRTLWKEHVRNGSQGENQEFSPWQNLWCLLSIQVEMTRNNWIFITELQKRCPDWRYKFGIGQGIGGIK